MWSDPVLATPAVAALPLPTSHKPVTHQTFSRYGTADECVGITAELEKHRPQLHRCAGIFAAVGRSVLFLLYCIYTSMLRFLPSWFSPINIGVLSGKNCIPIIVTCVFQIKVREATSNDPWGPSSTLMSEVADLTYNVVAFTEIMQMIWKRLNDHGRNWRHVYKALVLLEYLIKTGSEKVILFLKTKSSYISWF